MSRLIFHIDVNSAFLSWTAIERLRQGDTIDLREIPSIIGGDKEKPRRGFRRGWIGYSSTRAMWTVSSWD